MAKEWTKLTLKLTNLKTNLKKIKVKLQYSHVLLMSLF